MNKYTVTVLGKPYPVKLDCDEEHIKKIESLLNGYIERYNPESKIVNYLDLVVYASLGMADELLSETEHHKNAVTQAGERLTALISRIDKLQ